MFVNVFYVEVVAGALVVEKASTNLFIFVKVIVVVLDCAPVY
jgi:hypothetical protein